jgi:periplasmic divalent cation tolerance protein
MTGRIVVALSTAPSEEKAVEIARALVTEGLAACVNVVPRVRSIYAWKGELTEDSEVLCVVKTSADRVPALLARLPALHPYEVPELVVLDVTAGHGPYLDWVLAQTR